MKVVAWDRRAGNRMTETEFWARADSAEPESCWLWLGAMGNEGYGHAYWDGKVQLAHRVAYMLHYGDPGELCVLHTCDVRPCVNPAHLWLGDRAANNRDRDAKQRSRRDSNGRFVACV